MDCASPHDKDLEKAEQVDKELSGIRSASLKPSFDIVLLCWDPQHTEGYVSKGCLRCTLSTCDACVIKNAFGKQDSTYANRRRHVCAECWARSEHPEIQLNRLQSKTQVSYAKRAEFEEFCQCTVPDGWLCSRCKTAQNSSLGTKLEQCVIEGCSKKPLHNCFGGRMCLWCDMPMRGRKSLGEARREYDSLHLRARAYSACEPLTPVEEVDDPEIGWLQIRRKPKPVFLGQGTPDLQRQPASKPRLLRAHSVPDPSTPDSKGEDSLKMWAGLLRRMSLKISSYKRRSDVMGLGLRTSMGKWRSSSTSLLIQSSTSNCQKQDQGPAMILLYEGP